MPNEKAHRFDHRFPDLKRNIFIVTYGRTGSTLLQNLLMTIPDCHMRGENHNIIESIWHSAMRCRMAKSVWGKEEVSSSHPWYGSDQMRPVFFAQGMIDSFVNNVLCPPRDARYFGFKEIRYNALGDQLPEVLDFMRFHFKDALFIFNTRNLDDVANSAWWKNWNREDVVSLVQGMDRRFAEYHAAHPEFTEMLAYENFSSDPLALKPLFEKLGEPFDEARIKSVLSNRLKH
nr:sulfotransferase [Paracoccus marinaquae]